jgi:hypothetical protein
LAAKQAKKLNQTFSTIVPPAVKPAPTARLKSARVLPLSLSNAPTANIGAALARLYVSPMQGPVPVAAGQEKQGPKRIINQQP